MLHVLTSTLHSTHVNVNEVRLLKVQKEGASASERERMQRAEIKQGLPCSLQPACANTCIYARSDLRRPRRGVVLRVSIVIKGVCGSAVIRAIAPSCCLRLAPRCSRRISSSRFAAGYDLEGKEIHKKMVNIDKHDFVTTVRRSAENELMQAGKSAAGLHPKPSVQDAIQSTYNVLRRNNPCRRKQLSTR